MSPINDLTPYLAAGLLFLGLLCCVLGVAVFHLSGELRDTRQELNRERDICNGYRATFRGLLRPLPDKEER